jgi:hypothetical protein
MIILRQKSYSIFGNLFRRENTTPVKNKLPDEYYTLLQISEELRGHKFFKTEAFLGGYPEYEGVKYPHLIVLPEDKIDLTKSTTGDMPIVYICDINGLGYNFSTNSWYTCEFKKLPKPVNNLKQYLLSTVKKGIDRLKEANVINHSLSNFETLVNVAAEENYISKEDINKVLKFQKNPNDPSWME